jgi:hypothetical protein
MQFLQFFHEVAQNESWMLDDIKNAAVLLDRANIKRNMQGYDASRMLFELKVSSKVCLFSDDSFVKLNVLTFQFCR